MRRRTLLFGAAGLAGTWVVPAEGAQAGGALSVDISLGTDPPEAVVAMLRDLDATDVQQVKHQGLGGTETIVAGILLVKGLANLVVRLLSVWRCGIVMDARTARILTERNCDLAPGTVLVIAPDGARSTLTQPSAPQLQALIQTFPRSQ